MPLIWPVTRNYQLFQLAQFNRCLDGVPMKPSAGADGSFWPKTLLQILTNKVPTKPSAAMEGPTSLRLRGMARQAQNNTSLRVPSRTKDN